MGSSLNKGCGEAFWCWVDEVEGPAECGKEYEFVGLALCVNCSPNINKESKDNE